MFFSHQLLARKAPLGQIWMAATMHAKIHRRKLDKLDIIKICEEILNPSVPMALRLSGILMGGVVIVYERKVKLLYDDVTRLLVEINEAWKVKTAPSDPTRLPKGKSQAKYEAVTLPPNENEDLGETEEEPSYSNGLIFQQNSYIAMRLDSVEDLYLNQNPLGDLDNDHHHQADAADITIFDNCDSYKTDATGFNRFERFDVEEDGEMRMNFTPPDYSENPTLLIPSPHHEEDLVKAHYIQEHSPEEQFKQQSDEVKKANKDAIKQRVARRRKKAPAALAMDYEQNMVPGQIYQSWLKNTPDIMRRKRKLPIDSLSRMKISTRTDLPSIVLFERLVASGNGQIHYPAPLMDMWIKCIQSPHDSPSGRTSHPPPQPSSSSTPPEGVSFKESTGDDPFEDIYSKIGSLSRRISIEKTRAVGMENDALPTPENYGDNDTRSVPSSGSDHGNFSHNPDNNSGRSGKKRLFSASNNSGNGLESVAEEYSWQDSDPAFKISKVSEDRLPPDDEPLLETGPTQTHKPLTTDQQPLDHITDSIRLHFKTQFDTPGAAQSESLNQLAFGMNKKAAAALFYQTCVLATRDYVKVEQKNPYGDILISRGAKM